MKFNPKTKEEERGILFSDDSNFTKTKEYLGPLIEVVLDKFTFGEMDYRAIYNNLIDLVPWAAGKFLGNKKNLEANYKFSTYFTWYIKEELQRYDVERK